MICQFKNHQSPSNQNKSKDIQTRGEIKELCTTENINNTKFGLGHLCLKVDNPYCPTYLNNILTVKIVFILIQTSEEKGFHASIYVKDTFVTNTQRHVDLSRDINATGLSKE